MNYNYDTELECFVREDGLGKKFYITSTEAHRIITMYNLGNSIGEIRNKIQFRNPKKVTESTIKNFIINVNSGNIVLDDNLPAPSDLVEDLTNDDRLRKLEERVERLENLFVDDTIHEESVLDKVKSWIKS